MMNNTNNFSATYSSLSAHMSSSSVIGPGGNSSLSGGGSSSSGGSGGSSSNLLINGLNAMVNGSAIGGAITATGSAAGAGAVMIGAAPAVSPNLSFYDSINENNLEKLRKLLELHKFDLNEKFLQVSFT